MEQDLHKQLLDSLEAAAKGPDARQARRARMTLAAIVPFYEQVNREIVQSPADESDICVFSDAGMCLASGLSYIVDHMVVRGARRAEAVACAVDHLKSCMKLIEQQREQTGYVPTPFDDPQRPFDFRAMLRKGA